MRPRVAVISSVVHDAITVQDFRWSKFEYVFRKYLMKLKQNIVPDQDQTCYNTLVSADTFLWKENALLLLSVKRRKRPVRREMLDGGILGLQPTCVSGHDLAS